MSAFRDLTGQRFGKLVLLSWQRSEGRTLWQCACDCGAAISVRADMLTRADKKAVRSCPSCRQKPCVICGAPFFRTGRAVTCGKPECVEARLSMKRAESESRRTLDGRRKESRRAAYLRLLADSEKLAIRRQTAKICRLLHGRSESDRTYYARHREEIGRRREAEDAARTPERRDEYARHRRNVVAKSKGKAALRHIQSTLLSKLKSDD